MLMKATGDNASIRVVIASIDYFGFFKSRLFTSLDCFVSMSALVTSK